MNTKRTLSVLLATLVLCVHILVGGALAQDDMQTVTIEATEDGLVVPEIVSAGWVEIVFENTSEFPLYSIIGRLDDEATIDDFLGALMGMFSGEAGVVPPATFLGSPLTLPEETQTAMYNLEAGTYVVVSVAGEQPDFATFVVEGDMSENDTEIEADLTITLADFVFGLPIELNTGEQIWQIENRGEQWHEMVFIPIPEGSTMEDAMMMLMSAEGDAESEDGGALDLAGIEFLWSPISEDENALLRIDLAPGTYLVSCFIPDINSEEMMSHAELGMMQIVTVLEEE